jgi:hypothetical protein
MVLYVLSAQLITNGMTFNAERLLSASHVDWGTGFYNSPMLVLSVQPCLLIES